MIAFTPPIQAAWNLFQSIAGEMLTVEPARVVYGQGIVFCKGDWSHCDFLDANGIFVATAHKFGVNLAIFDANPILDVDGSFEALCFALRLTEEAPDWLLKSRAADLRLKVAWTIPVTPTA
ncbi:MAG: hypothetical protein WCV73_01470 [Patescibacteria group bacterium]|jgi:hypothetical protein